MIHCGCITDFDMVLATNEPSYILGFRVKQ